MTTRLHTPEQAARWLQARVTGSLSADSRNISPGDGFIAWPGAASDGRKYVGEVLAAGALACLIEEKDAEAFGVDDARIATYLGLKAACGAVAAAYFDSPSHQLQIVAVTGTNGKTTTAMWLAQALSRLGRKCGVVGTLGIGQPGAMVANGLTTPDPVLLQQQLRRFADEGFRACALEASSIGIEERRLDATQIQVAIFTNFTQDHLDYHASMQDYWRAKEMLFGWPGLKAAVINVDDIKGLELSATLARTDLDVWTFSCSRVARLQARNIQHGALNLSFDVIEGGEIHPVSTPMVGHYNVSNLLGVMAALRAMDVSLTDAVGACADLLPVPGRTETLAMQGLPLVVIDYAHTPDALEKVLVALRPVAASRKGQLWCVFGCGGDRDGSKRPVMAAIAEQHADQIVVTSDNPRSENPLTIISQVMLGLSHRDAVHVQADRAAAIEHALTLAQSTDVVLVAGKGHERYQEVCGVKLPFSDRDHAQAALNALAAMSGKAEESMMSLQQAVAFVPLAKPVGDLRSAFRRVHTDTRSIEAGDLFVALKGENFDAHQFLAQARDKGAVAAIAQQGLIEAGLPGLEVADARLALGQLAAGWRSRFTLPLIAVTGSNGKTTVTQMIASILQTWKADAAFATAGNLNNDIGVPLTLLRLRASHEVGVVELGMNHPGEIAYLSALTRPTVALINNAQREHLEFMATVEAVALENGSVLQSLAAGGIAIFPADDDYTSLWRGLAGSRKVLTFALTGPADITASARWSGECWQVLAQTPAGSFDFSLHAAGLHNVKNALAATACALATDVPLSVIAAGLSTFVPVKGRSRAIRLQFEGNALIVVDDSYNANPDSMQAAVEVLADLPGPRLLVMGDMGEVGNQGPLFHGEAGAHARARGIEKLFTLGDQSKAAAAAFGQARHFPDMAALITAAVAELPHVASVLVKGSRFMKMEKLVDAVIAAGSSAQQDKEAPHDF